MKYYVYELIDPRDNTVFYVGKGSGNRVSHHEREARSGILNPKCDLIREIWDSGLEIEREIVQRFTDETAAYAFERDRIEKYGLDSLTNLIPGFIPSLLRDNQSRKNVLNRHSFEIIARSLKWIHYHKKIVLDGGHDITEIVIGLVRKISDTIGFDKLSKELEPHGVILKVT